MIFKYIFGTNKRPLVTDEKIIRQTILRRIEPAGIFPNEKEAIELFKKKSLRIYLGIDPTGPNIHIGHTIPLLWLKGLWEIGHQPVIVIGDFTARIGDPTGKDTARKSLTAQEVKENMKNYLGQVRKILPRKSFKVRYNSSWLSKMSFEDVVKLASHVTVQQMLQRDMFQKRLWRWKCPNCRNISQSPVQFGTQQAFETATLSGNTIECKNCNKTVPFEKGDIFSEPIFLHEFLYPLMQGYDSVAMKIDGEVGGNDQTFNMLVGRDLEKKLLGKNKLVFATQILVDANTGKKMSKSEGGLIALSDSPTDMFGKTMKTVPDGFIFGMFKLCTEKSQEWLDENTKEKIEANPNQFKKDLAFELVRKYHGEKEAQKAKDEWERVFSKGELPENIDEVPGEGMKLVDFITEHALATSSSEAKRLLDQGAVSINEKVSKEWGHMLKRGDIVRVGPRKFLKVL